MNTFKEESRLLAISSNGIFMLLKQPLHRSFYQLSLQLRLAKKGNRVRIDEFIPHIHKYPHNDWFLFVVAFSVRLYSSMATRMDTNRSCAGVTMG
jgi:hypothetical protein